METNSTSQIHHFFDPETDLIATFKNEKLTSLSPAWERLLGWSLDEISKMNLDDLIHPDDLEITHKEIEKIERDGKTNGFVNRYVSKDREIKWIKWRCFRNPLNSSEIISVGADLTELYLKNHDHKISQQEAKIGNWSFGKVSRKFSWSEQICDIYETPIDTNFVKVLKAHFHDEINWNKMSNAFTLCLEKGETQYEEVQLTTPNKRNKWIACWWLPRKIGQEIIGVEGLIQDITNRKEKERVIKETDNRYEVVLSGINAGIWDWTDVNGQSQYWSPKLYEILKYSAEEFKPTVDIVLELIHPDDLPKIRAAISNLVEFNVHYNLEYRVKCGDGQYKWIQSSAVALRDENGHTWRVIGIVIDIHDQKTAEAHLEEEKQKSVQASKLATLGEMAAGLAHEVNNPLTIIFGYIRILEDELGSTQFDLEQGKKFLGLIKSAADRAAKIVSSLKEFARDGAQDPFEDYPSSEIMSMVLELSQERFKKNAVKLDIEMADDPVIHCRKLEISQVILNLLFNSFDAIQELNPKWVKVQIKKESGKILINVIDCGHGLVPEVAEKIFTPFYTTKKTGQGTGLGLSISQRIIVNHGGEIYYDNSSLNTKFVIKLPLYYELP